MSLTSRPVTLAAAKLFVGEHHRHNLPPEGWLFGTGAEAYGHLVGVAIVGRPVARAFDDGKTCEVLRCCTDGFRNACSFLYGAAWRMATAGGYSRAYTYTLTEEAGASLKASGWTLDALLPAREVWQRSGGFRVQTDLFGNERRPAGEKYRWVKSARPTVYRPSLVEALKDAWGDDTANTTDWSAENPAAGQCAVTALVVQDYLGGVLLRGMVEGGSHYWNRRDDGSELDLTRQQFAAFSASDVGERTREYVLANPDTARRYETLAARVRSAIEDHPTDLPDGAA